MFNREKAKELVDASELKRSAIADRVGIETATLTKYLNGFGSPSRRTVRDLAEVLGVPVPELWAEQEPTAA